MTAERPTCPHIWDVTHPDGTPGKQDCTKPVMSLVRWSDGSVQECCVMHASWFAHHGATIEDAVYRPHMRPAQGDRTQS